MPTNKPGYIRQYYADQKALLHESLGGVCVVCGTYERLEVHHVEEWAGPQKGAKGRGSLHRLTDAKIQARLGKVVLMCHACHVTQHRLQKTVKRAQAKPAKVLA